jgi:hypothetical protein
LNLAISALPHTDEISVPSCIQWIINWLSNRAKISLSESEQLVTTIDTLITSLPSMGVIIDRAKAEGH